MAGPIPKQYRTLDDIPVIRHTLTAFMRHPEIDRVQAVIHPDDGALYEQASAGLDLPPPVIGGATRQESVRFGLQSFAADPPHKILIHDAVRPFVEQGTISAVIRALDERPAVITGLSLPDTLKRCADGIITATVDRTGLWRAQTPQGFHFADLLRAHEHVALRDPNSTELTDDSSVIEQFGVDVAMIEGGDDNFKITTERDLTRAQLILERGRQDTHVGWGFDFDVFGPGEQLIMCGIPIPFGAAVARTHNPDILLNAVTDGLLGTIGGHASGSHFQPELPGFRGRTSDFFIRQAVSLVARNGGRIRHVDLTALAAQPDIAPYADAMSTRLSSLLSVEPGRISIKQVATYQTAFYGRNNGIGAQCLVTAVFPSV